jgi:hypothetical protein
MRSEQELPLLSANDGWVEGDRVLNYESHCELRGVCRCLSFRSESPGLVTSSSAAMRGKAPPPCSRLRKASAGQGLPHPQLRK